MLFTSCGDASRPIIEGEIRLFTTTGEDSMFVEQTPLSAGESSGDAWTVELVVDVEQRFQTIDGFGASFTDSSAYLINQVLSDEDRESLMTSLFDREEGIGLSFTRQPMGASDFARTIYSYNDLPEGETDVQLEKFSIEHDLEDIIPLLQRAKEINPDLLLMASPWSPPAWMKTSGSMIGGALLRDYYDTYANYFVRYIEEYAKHGLEIYAVTPQNEPLYVPAHYPGNDMNAQAQAAFIRDALGPAFEANNIDTKIICYDHNWDVTDYAKTVLGSKSGQYVDGVAWHVYGGSPEAMSEVLAEYPDHEVYFTEASGGEWVPPFEQAFMGTMLTGINVLNNYSRCIVLWNMALDEENGPVVPGFGRSTCRGVVKINQQTGELIYNLDYYALAHFSKFIRTGAVRVASESKGSIHTTACLNPDGTLVVVVANDGGAKSVRLMVDGKAVEFEMAGKSASTLVF